MTIEPDQEVGGDCRDVEEHEQENEIERAGQADHREHEQDHPGPEPACLGSRSIAVGQVEGEVSPAVREDEAADPRRQQPVHHREAVKREFQAESERGGPWQADRPAGAEAVMIAMNDAAAIATARRASPPVC